MATTYEMGFINVPISPTFVGIAGKLNDQLIKPARDAGKKAATEVEKSVEASVKGLERQVAASTKKLGDLDRAHQDSVSKREAQQGKLNAAIAEQSAAEEKYQKALKKGDSGLAELAKVEKAKAKVTDETLKLTKAERDITDAEQKHKAQLEDLRRTTEKYEKAQKGANDEVGKSKGVFGGIRDSMKGLRDQVSEMPGPLGSIGDTLSSFKAGPAAGVMAVVTAVGAAGTAFGKWNEDLVQSRVSMQNTFGLTADDAREFQGEIAEALGSGLGGYEETAEAVMEISQTLGDNVAHMGGMTAAQLADDFLAFNQTFERSAAETASTVDVMLNSGMVSSAQEGIDLLTKGMQSVPAAMQDEVFDAMNEYSKNFSNLGITGSEAMAMLVDASENGQYAIDKTGDAIKEFSVLAIDEAKAEAFESIGLNAESMATAVAGGGDSARQALQDTAKALLDIEDPGKRAATAVELFGAPIEDLGVDQIPAFLDSLTAGSEGMGDFEGSAQTMADNTTRTFSGMMNSVKGRIQGWAIETTLAMNEWAGDMVSAIANSNVGQFWGDILSDAWETLKTYGGFLVDYWQFLGDRVSDVFSFIYGTYDKTVGYVLERAGDLAAPLVEKFNWAKDNIQIAWDEITAAFTGGDWGYGALAELIGVDRAEWVVDKISSIKPAWDEIVGAITGVDWGYGALENLIGTERAQWVLEQIDSVRNGFIEFRDRLVEGFDQVRDALAPVFEWLQEFVTGQLSGTLESLMDTFSSLWDSIQAVGEALGGAFGSALEGLFAAAESVWEALKPVAELFMNILMPVLKIIGGLIGGVVVGAILLFVGAIRLGAEIIERFAGVIQWLSEKVLAPLIGFIGEVAGFLIEHLVGAVAGTIERFAEFGNYLIENFWPAVQSVMEWVGSAFSAVWDGIQWAWEKIIQPVFEGIWTVAKVTLGVIGTLILAPLLIAWNLLSAGIQWAWETIIQPVWDAISTFATETLWPLLQSAFEWIGEKWSQLSELFGTVWEWLRDSVFTPLSAFVTETLWPALESAFTWIGDKWQWLSDMLSVVWGFIKDYVFTPLMAVVQMVWDGWSNIIGWMVDRFHWFRDLLVAAWVWIDQNVFVPLRAGIEVVAFWFEQKLYQINNHWDWLKFQLQRGWAWIDENVFAPLGRGLDTVKGWFETAVDGIGTAWKKIEALTAKPINFVIEYVYGGIRSAWGAVANLVDLPELPEIQKIGGFAEGTARVPGARTRHDNVHLFSPEGFSISLRGGEGVVVPEVVDALGEDTINDLNRVALQRGVGGVHHYLEHLGGFSQGGIIDSMMGFVSKHFPALSMTSGWRFTDNGMHSRGQAADFSNQVQGGPSTPESRGLARAIFKNFPNQTEQLIHWQLDGWQNLLSGRPFNYGEPTNSQHTDHVHWGLLKPLNYDADELDLSGGGGGGIFETITAMAKKLWDPIINKIPSYGDEEDATGGLFGDLPGAFLGKISGAAWDHIKSLADQILSPFTGGSGGGAEQWRDTARLALRRFGYGDEYLDIMLKQIEIESTGDPNAVNRWDSNWLKGTPSRGLLQVIDPTYRDVRNRYPDAFAGLPDDPTHPLTNLVAGIGALERDWGGPAGGRWPTRDGYSEGGIVDLFTRDLGGWVPDGALVRNTSGRDELMLPPELSAAMTGFFADYPEAAELLAVAADHIESAAEWLATAADSTSVEGITARQSARRFLDLGLDIPGLGIMEGLLDSEEDLLASRARHLGHLDNLVEKEKAVADAREALAKLESSEDKLSTQDQRKLDDAQKAVDEARANVAKADSEEKRAKATEKLADSEEKLRRVREDLDENATKNAEKHAEEITKANEQVAKAEQDLLDAKAQQVKDLDHLVLISQESVMGLVPQAESLAEQLLGMGAPAGMVSQGLGAVTGALASVAGMAGPAGITLGMAFDAVKIGIELVTTVVDVITEIVEQIHAARMAALDAMAEGWRIVAEYADLVSEMQANVSSLQQEIVRGLNEQRTAEFALRVAQQDRLIAEAEGALAVAEARLALDREIERGNIAAQLRLMGLHEDWDSYLSFQALASQGMLDHWSDAAIGALFDYEAARAKALQAELTARVDQINAEAQLAQATRQNLRNQADLLKAQERLILMSAEVAGVDLVEATATAQVADIVVQMAELQKQMDSNLLGKAGVFLGTSGPWSNEYRGQQKQMEVFRDTLEVLFQEHGVSMSDSQLNKAIEQMGWVSVTGGDPMAVLRQFFPELVDAERALQLGDSLSPIWDAEDKQSDAERDAEDFLADIDLFDRVTPLEETIKGLDYTIKGFEDASAAWAKGNEDLRSEYLQSAWAKYQAGKNLGVDWQLDGNYATPGVRDQIQREITINWNGPGSEEDIQRMVDEILAGSNTTATVKKTASTVAKAKRGVMA